MRTPAEKYAEFRRRTISPDVAVITDFEAMYAFDLDDFQLEGAAALAAGESVLVAAPTGAGKTVVGEFAVHLALQAGTKCFYTTPIKALSNQKYHDLVARYGADDVGLLTGDNSINGDAPVVVMTTEVLRNMIYAGSSTLAGLAYVVMDEVHYLADRFRGPVWEEVIISLPESVAVVALSATVSNAEEFGDWLAAVRGTTRVIVEEHRPVPLWQNVMAGERIYDLFVDDEQTRVNPVLVRLARESDRVEKMTRGHYVSRPTRGGTRRKPVRGARRPEVVERLQRDNLLPAIVFVFSRAGCDGAVKQCRDAGLRLATSEERQQIRAVVERRTADLADADLAVLGYHDWLDGLERGVAAHHAGMLPTFKETVEELFTLGLIDVVFATETLALGINMPARTVVLERLVKWNGETHARITPGEYTQLTGRAGRRGIDIEGNAVVVWHQGFDPSALAGLASTRTYPLRSSFRPSYNMTVNLVSSVGWSAGRELLETSFAQFQADRAVVGLARSLRRQHDALAELATSMECHLGDFTGYSALRRELTERERTLSREGSARRRAESSEALARLAVGDVILLSSGRRAGPAVVIDPGTSAHEEPRPLVLTLDKQVRRLSIVDFPTPPVAAARVRLPKNFDSRSANSRRDVAAILRDRASGLEWERPTRRRAMATDDAIVVDLRARLRAHPCHGCADREEHARWAERYWRLRGETDAVERRVEHRTSSIARQFDQVAAILADLGYLTDATAQARVTTPGRLLQRLYTESDLLAAQCLRDRLWDDLRPADLAAVVSALVYETRRADDDSAPRRLPSRDVSTVIAAMETEYQRLRDLELQHRVQFLRAPDPGFATAVHRWASGHSLESVLDKAELEAGDFVRWCKQVIDLLGQVADAASARDGGTSALADSARDAVRALRRGIVGYSSV